MLMRLAGQHWLSGGLAGWAALAPAGGAVVIANEIPIMQVPTRPDTAAHTAALAVSMAMPFCDGSIWVTLR